MGLPSRLGVVLVTAMLSACATLAPPVSTAPITLSGDLTDADHQTYCEIPFAVPRGVGRITIELAYSGKDQRTVIDMGVRDPQGQRGWSGGNKSKITISEFDATPSYKPGRIQLGARRLVLGIPNIREGQTAHFDAKVTFGPADLASRPPAALAAQTLLSSVGGWRRGDFHAHTGHSDGTCDIAGTRSPCPVMRTAEAARDAGLDFIAVNLSTIEPNAQRPTEIVHLGPGASFGWVRPEVRDNTGKLILIGNPIYIRAPVT